MEDERLAREVEQLRVQAETNFKERAALKTIMESKIKVPTPRCGKSNPVRGGC